VFNAQEWIADTLRSVLVQTWSPKEIIVVDDGSTDRTLAIARQFEAAGVPVITQGPSSPSSVAAISFISDRMWVLFRISLQM
jgi:glycosyltransferase involved in cell wall biosynthesis